MTKPTVHLVSMSGGKDSTATLLMARELYGDQTIIPIFADTGNEHELTIEYLGYLEQALDIQIVRLKRDFTEWWWHRRNYVRDVWPEKLVRKDGISHIDAAIMVRRVLAVFEKGPTGNPYLDLCMIKGRFPSRKAQFCTQFLKTEPLTEYAINLIDAGNAVWSWQGIRAQESPGRALAPEFEEVGGGLFIYRPIKRWTALDTFEAHRAVGVLPNPLYKLGMSRVGCMPCINANKAEIAEIARRFPEHIDRIEEWEGAVCSAGKRADISSFFPAPEDGRGDRMGRNIRQVVRWSQTTRGGMQFDLIRATEELPACSSAYGLCE